MDTHLSPTETARRFGVTVNALRLYEDKGLITPLRAQNGWRIFGPDQIARLHQILALKQLGLSLVSIGQLLQSADTLETVLALTKDAFADPVTAAQMPYGKDHLVFLGMIFASLKETQLTATLGVISPPSPG